MKNKISDMKGFKCLLAKAYFDKGYSLTSYIKYAVAVFAIKTPAKSAIIAGLCYIPFCYLLGRWFYNSKLIETEIEIGNIFNPFCRDVRRKI